MNTSNLIKTVNDYLNLDNLDDAQYLLEEGITADPENVELLQKLGLVYLLGGNEITAQAIWSSTIEFTTETDNEEIKIADLIKFLESETWNSISKRKLGNAQTIYDSIISIAPSYKNQPLLDALIDSLTCFALGLIDNGERDFAIDVYLEILKISPNHVNSIKSLALNYYLNGDIEYASAYINKLTELNSLNGDSYYLLALILEKQNKHEKVIDAYQSAIKLNPHFISAYINLGDLFLKIDRAEMAIDIFKKAFLIAPKNLKVTILEKLADAYKVLGNEEEYVLNLANAAYQSGNTALTPYKLNDAINYFKKYLSLKKTIHAYTYLIHSLILINETSEAVSMVNEALALFPKSMAIKRINQAILPVIYKCKSEIRNYYLRFRQALLDLTMTVDLNTTEGLKDAYNSLSLATNFYITYQGYNVVDTQRLYGSYSYRILSKMYAHTDEIFLPKIPSQPSGVSGVKKIRIGYVSARLHNMIKIYPNWFKYSNKDEFEHFVYDFSGYTSSLVDEYSLFKKNISQVDVSYKTLEGNMDSIIKTIKQDFIDILIFLESGLDFHLDQLAHIKIAPVQCVAWGHPVTSGSPAIDFFLSGDLMEPPDGDKHYTEELIRLPNLGFSISPPDLPVNDATRADFELSEDATIYLCSQSLIKYLPQYDYIFPSIAQSNPRSQFVFFDSFLGKIITDIFIERISQSFKQFGMDSKQYCIFSKHIKHEDYLKLSFLADIFLDTFEFSGGLTTIDAIACGLPVVTCPGTMMRGRQSYAMLKMIGVTETITYNEKEYIKIAIKLGNDIEWRRKIRAKILRNNHLLFDDRDCVLGLENFAKHVVF